MMSMLADLSIADIKAIQKAIYESANVGCKKAVELPRSEFPGACVNWGDFHCNDVTCRMGIDDSIFFVAEFDEGSAFGQQLHDFIQRHIKDATGDLDCGVYLEIEW